MNKYSNIFNQIQQILPRYEFERIVRKHEAEKHAKGFCCWNQLVSMLFLQLSKSCSLTEVCQGLSTCAGKLSHLGLTKAPCKSTLAYANQHRPWEIYQDLFYLMLDKCRTKWQNLPVPKTRIKKCRSAAFYSHGSKVNSMISYFAVPHRSGRETPLISLRRLCARNYVQEFGCYCVLAFAVVLPHQLLQMFVDVLFGGLHGCKARGILACQRIKK
jgi:hypothetical protein